jgi:hypothetical protein
MGINSLISNFKKLNINTYNDYNADNDYDADNEMTITKLFKKRLISTKKLKKFKKNKKEKKRKNKKLQELIYHMLIASLSLD